MNTVNWLSPHEHWAWRSWQSMNAKLNAVIASQLSKESGLSYADYEVLVVLTDQESGCLRPRQIGEELGWEQSRVSHQVARMAKRGLVEQGRCPEDGRGTLVTITEQGRSAIEAAAPSHVQVVRDLAIDPLTPAQLDALGKASNKILLALGEATVPRPLDPT